MKTSDAGINLIRKYEGLRLAAYKAVPTEKYWTIGYGHYGSDVHEGMTITETQAVTFLRADLVNAERYVSQYEPIYHFTQAQFDALVSFTFNCGAGNLRKLVDGGMRTIAEISNAIPNYNKSGGKVLNGLVKRRLEERAMFDRGTTKKPLETIVDEVIAHKWGDGNDRRQRLEKAGYNFREVQDAVNAKLKK